MGAHSMTERALARGVKHGNEQDKSDQEREGEREEPLPLPLPWLRIPNLRH